MANEGRKRKLTAILSADVKDYSRLMSQDEVGTIETLKAYRDVIAGDSMAAEDVKAKHTTKLY
jgi:class 3 adenylate cyclase